MVSLISQEHQLENGNCSSRIRMPKYKRRKVSAIRDFPLGCGQNGTRLSLQEREEVGSVQKSDGLSKDVVYHGEKGNDLSNMEGKRLLEKVVESESHDNFAGSNGARKVVLEDSKQLPNLRKMDGEPMSKDEIQGSSKDLMEVRVESPSLLKNTGLPELEEAGNDIKCEMMVEGTSVQPSLLTYRPLSSVAWKEQKYPPGKRVSAVRDFPPGCGRNVPRVSEAEYENLGRDQTDANTHNNEGVMNDENRIGRDYGADDALIDEIKGVVSRKSGDELESRFGIDEGTCAEEKNNERCGGEAQKSEYDGKDERDMGDLQDGENKEIVVFLKDKREKKKSGGVSRFNIELQEERMSDVGNEKHKVVLQGLVSSAKYPWRMKKAAVKSITCTTSLNRSKGNEHDTDRPNKNRHSPNKRKDNTENSGERSMMILPYLNKTVTDDVSREPVFRDEGDSSENDEYNDFQLVPRRSGSDVSLLPFGAASLSERGIRSKVKEALQLFQGLVKRLQRGEKKKLKDRENARNRVDLNAARILRDNGKYINTGKPILGHVPGVPVGDYFQYRVELMIVGLHRPPQSGIDYLKQGQTVIATSIVASGGYANDVDSSDVLIYTGQGGNGTGGDKLPEDQKLERGNLALKNSMDKKNVVRVIRGFKEIKPAERAGERPKIIVTYTYDGLYTVERYWHELGSHGKLVYKFELRRVPGQPELAWKEVKKSKKYKVREGRCVDDISEGKEKLPICAVNTVDDEKPPPFTYISSMIYPDWCQPIPPMGCDCKHGCSDSSHCSCAFKNGGEIPYNFVGEIVEEKPLVYECGPTCKCPPSCPNRVSQHGTKFPLEIFKTESRGWGVRSLSSIPSGSFICEYIGELLDDKEAEQRTGNDEYLFDIGQNYNDSTLRDGLLALMPDMALTSSDVVENVGFTIDAAKYGNIGRFINHSCSPNLYAQNVLYDHDDKRIPHIMLFAVENIPPLQELAYHYNYTIDQVLDSDGNVKKKSCFCGSSECTGRMY